MELQRVDDRARRQGEGGAPHFSEMLLSLHTALFWLCGLELAEIRRARASSFESKNFLEVIDANAAQRVAYRHRDVGISKLANRQRLATAVP